jgi:putative photosynthetic complex assembly protein
MTAFQHEDHHHHIDMPKVPLYAAFAMVLMTILLVAVARIGGVGQLHTPQTAVTAERTLLFADRADGAVLVTDGRTGELLETVDPGTNGFLRGTIRGLARDRKRSGIGPDVPFRLTSRADGRLLLEDPATGRLIDLGAFGPVNAAVFTRMLAAPAPIAAVDTDQATAATQP